VTVGEALDRAVRRIGGESAVLDARILLEAACGSERSTLFSHPERELDPQSVARFEGMLARREVGEPVAYIVGSAGFYGRVFSVDRRVLVPRPETEHLVEAVLDYLRGTPAESVRAVADVGTGCGAIAITLAAEDPRLHVAAGDCSGEALAVARLNARRLGTEGVHFVEGDLLEPLSEDGPFDVVVANLPYVPTVDVPNVPHPVGYEPRVALDGGRDGLDLYRRLLEGAESAVKRGGAIFMEAAPGTIEALAACAEASFPGAGIEIGTDYAGLDRYVVALL
jgi:release factor glutamine methyltransferase